MDKVKCDFSLKNRLAHDLRRNWILWLMFLPVIIYYAIFNYAPMYGLVIAFKDYKVRRGILGSPNVGFKYFERFFSSYNFVELIQNTLGISLYSLLVGFPLAILFAVLLLYLPWRRLKNGANGFLCSVFYFYRGHLRHAHHLYGPHERRFQ